MNDSLLLFNARSISNSFTSSSRVDNEPANALFLLGKHQICNFSLGNADDYEMALAVTLPLPEPNAFIQQTKDLGLPEMFGFVSACLGVLLAVYLIKTWKQ